MSVLDALFPSDVITNDFIGQFTPDPATAETFVASVPDTSSVLDWVSGSGIVNGIASVGKTTASIINAIGGVTNTVTAGNLSHEVATTNLQLQKDALSVARLNSAEAVSVANSRAAAAANPSAVTAALNRMSATDKIMIFLGVAGVGLAYAQLGKGK